MRQFKVQSNITPRGSKAMGIYMSEIAKYPRLTPYEEEDLAFRAQRGDKKARETLIKSNLRFVVSVANSFGRKDVPLEDLINEGNIGLAIAADRFDPTRGFKFISYAVWWICQCILAYLQVNIDQIRKPMNVQSMVSKLAKTRSKLLGEGTYVDDRTILEDLGYSNKEIKMFFDASTIEFRGDLPTYEDIGTSYFDMLTSEDTPLVNVQKEDVGVVIGSVLTKFLNEREQQIIKSVYGIGTQRKSLYEIGTDLGLSKERTRQIMCKALTKLRTFKCKAALRDYA